MVNRLKLDEALTTDAKIRIGIKKSEEIVEKIRVNGKLREYNSKKNYFSSGVCNDYSFQKAYLN